MPGTRVIMLGILPVANKTKWAKCQISNAFNAAVTCDKNEVIYLDLQDKFLQSDGSLKASNRTSLAPPSLVGVMPESAGLISVSY